MFDKLLAIFRGRDAKAATAAKPRQATSIDVRGAEFYDLYPTRYDFHTAVSAISAIRPEAVGWITEMITSKIHGGADYKGALEAVTRGGDLMGADKLKAMGLNPRRKIGSKFVDAVMEGHLKDASAALADAIHVTTSAANMLHGLRRSEEAGVTHCSLRSPGDKRETPLERQFNGKRLTISEARDLVRTRSAEIKRSSFRPEITF